jgi:hypothetical protein
VVESKLTKAYSDYDHSITKIKMQYEEKQRGLMPIEIKKVNSLNLFLKFIKFIFINLYSKLIKIKM